jgi:hypothetical protein
MGHLALFAAGKNFLVAEERPFVVEERQTSEERKTVEVLGSMLEVEVLPS